MLFCLMVQSSAKRKFRPLEANQILEAALSWGVFGNLKFETLLISSFLVIQSKDVCPSRASQIRGRFKLSNRQFGRSLLPPPPPLSCVSCLCPPWKLYSYIFTKFTCKDHTKFSTWNFKCIVLVFLSSLE